MRLHTGDIVTRDLAEQSTQLSNGLWVREVRVRGADGHQTSILSTHRHLDLARIAAWMPARWSQENNDKRALLRRLFVTPGQKKSRSEKDVRS